MSYRLRSGRACSRKRLGEVRSWLRGSDIISSGGSVRGVVRKHGSTNARSIVSVESVVHAARYCSACAKYCSITTIVML
jgi:hypothetical protein